MLKKITLYSLLIFAGITTVSFAQTLDGTPYTPGVDADVDMYMNTWKNSEPVITHGTLEERAILTKGDPLNPPSKGAVLKYITIFTHGTLPVNTSTKPTTLKNEQEIFYVLSGKGTIKAGRKNADLFSGICVFMPANKNFTITNSGDEPLTMYIIKEPTPEGFKPVKDMVVKDENKLPISSTNGHWTHIVKSVLTKDDGLAVMYTVLTVGHDSMTIGHPHSHTTDFEEVWTAIRGTSIAFLGKQIRLQPPGTAYQIPPDGKTPHANINPTDKPIKLLYFATRFDIK